jgi:crotonobetainyl-CoA:carnitine CoA-transferase CaiB-like acyl-CoA transferase
MRSGHIRVLDLSRVLAGPWCSQNLADLGADVIKIERPGSGDDTRAWGPPYAPDADGKDTTEAAYYLSANRGKRSVTVDIASPKARPCCANWRACDVVLENFKVGQLKRYGLDYESLKAIKPDLVYCSITGFGQDGPYAHRAGYDFLIQGMGGLMSVTGERDDLPGGGPQKAGVALTDLMTGMYATIAVLAALTHRDRTGEGQYIDMALLDTQVAMLANVGSNYLNSGKRPSAGAMRTPTSCPTRPSPARTATSSSPPATTASTRNSSKPAAGRNWRATRFATNPLRVQNRDVLVPLLAEMVPKTRATNGSRSWKRWACPAARSTTSAKCSPTSRCRRAAWRSAAASDGRQGETGAQPDALSATPPPCSMIASCDERRPTDAHHIGQHDLNPVPVARPGLDRAQADAASATGGAAMGISLRKRSAISRPTQSRLPSKATTPGQPPCDHR